VALLIIDRRRRRCEGTGYEHRQKLKKYFVKITIPKQQFLFGCSYLKKCDCDKMIVKATKNNWGSSHKRQKPQAPTPQAPIRNRQTRKVANANGLNRNTTLT